jgi:hypothetical protein
MKPGKFTDPDEAQVVHGTTSRKILLRRAHVGQKVTFPGDPRKWTVVKITWWLK